MAITCKSNLNGDFKMSSVRDIIYNVDKVVCTGIIISIVQLILDKMCNQIKYTHYMKCPVANFPIIGRWYCDIHEHWKVDLDV